MGAKIKITSESKQFQSEMQKITQDLKVMSSQLGVATTKAELFGTEQEKLSAKSKELNNNIKGQNTILGLQKQAIQSITGDVEKYRSRNTELSKSIGDVESKLKDSIKNTGENSKETKELQAELSKLQKEYNANEKAIEKSNKQIDNYKIKMNETEKAILQSKKALEDTDKKLATMNWDKASKDLEKFGTKTKDIGDKLTKRVTLPILGAGAVAVNFATDMEENINKVDTVFKNNSDEVKKWSDTTLDKFGIANVTALDMAATFGDMGSSMGIPLEEATKMSMSLVGLAGDLSSFKNIKIDVAKTALNGIYSGETESLKQLGVVMTQASLQEYAHSKGIKTKIQDMSESEKVNLRYAFVMDKLKNANGDFEKTSGGVANQSRVTKESFKQLGAEIGQNLLPIIANILQPLNDFLKKLTEMSPAQQKLIIGIGAVLAVIPLLLSFIGQISLGLSAITGLFASTAAGAAGTGGAFAMLTNPITIVIGVIAGLIAIFVALYKNNEDFRTNVNEVWGQIKQTIKGIIDNIKTIIAVFVQVAKEIWQKYGNDIINIAKIAFNLISSIIKTAMNIISNIIKVVTGIISGDWGKAWEGIKGLVSSILTGIGSIVRNALNLINSIFRTGLGIVSDIVGRVFNRIKDMIMAPIRAATNFIGEQVNKIKNFFSGLNIKLPKIKLPHFKLQGSFSLAPPSVPKLNIEWYKNGGIMTRPTAFGMNGNSLMVGGEAGAEGIIPLRPFWNELGKNFNKLEKRLNNKNNSPIFITNITTLDGKEIARETVEYTAEELEELRKQDSYGKGVLNYA